mmetsp:Transcript_5799/g.17130  ORF Transcript_5799/g.17130 Transcript_5799/m.17130 type:complete len:258 (-) Transcript_5799:196-969(-)
MASWMLSARFLWPGSNGIFTKSSLCRPSEGFSYSTERRTLTAAPPPAKPRCETTLVTELSLAMDPALRNASVSHAAPLSSSCAGVWGKGSPKCSPGQLAQMSCTSPGLYGPRVHASSRGNSPGAGPASTSLAASARSNGSGCSGIPHASCSRVLPLSRLKLTQPHRGPEPESRSYRSRTPSSSSSRTSAYVDSRSASAGDAVSLPVRTRMPPLSSPPITLQRPGPAATRPVLVSRSFPSFNLILTQPDLGPVPLSKS